MNSIGQILYFGGVACFLAALVIYFVVCGLRPLITRQPVVIHARWLVALFIPPLLIVELGSGASSARTLTQNSLDVWLLIAKWIGVGTLAVLGVFYWQQMKGYIGLGVTSAAWREIIRSALGKLNQSFQESATSFHLPSANADVRASSFDRLGIFRLYVKQRGQTPLLNQIVGEIRAQFKAHP